ncbi:MAG TPA: hypothetical protein VFG19_04390 [Geobacteraceae bacterium]|nr:hypothetical protein [Geobacteraceae bacterium]
MVFAIRRFYFSMLIAIFWAFPALRSSRIWKCRAKTPEYSCPAGYIPVLPEDFHNYIHDLGCPEDVKNTISIFIPFLLPIAAPFILGHLKKTGFSGCRVEVAERGLAVKAAR